MPSNAQSPQPAVASARRRATTTATNASATIQKATPSTSTGSVAAHSEISMARLRRAVSTMYGTRRAPRGVHNVASPDSGTAIASAPQPARVGGARRARASGPARRPRPPPESGRPARRRRGRWPTTETAGGSQRHRSRTMSQTSADIASSENTCGRSTQTQEATDSAGRQQREAREQGADRQAVDQRQRAQHRRGGHQLDARHPGQPVTERQEHLREPLVIRVRRAGGREGVVRRRAARAPCAGCSCRRAGSRTCRSGRASAARERRAR